MWPANGVEQVACAAAMDGGDANDGIDTQPAPAVDVGTGGGIDFGEGQDNRLAGLECEAGGRLVFVGDHGGGIHGYHDTGGLAICRIWS